MSPVELQEGEENKMTAICLQINYDTFDLYNYYQNIYSLLIKIFQENENVLDKPVTEDVLLHTFRHSRSCYRLYRLL